MLHIFLVYFLFIEEMRLLPISQGTMNHIVYLILDCFEMEVESLAQEWLSKFPNIETFVSFCDFFRI